MNNNNGSKKQQQLLDAALLLSDMFGWSLLPVVNKRAVGKWTIHQQRCATRDELHTLIHRYATTGIGVVAGEVSNQLVIRDFDEEIVYSQWAARFPALAKQLPTDKSPNGYHVYFRGPSFFQDLTDGEYRGDSGHYTVIPPSTLATGEVYRWLKIPSKKDLIYIDEPWKHGLCLEPKSVKTSKILPSPLLLPATNSSNSIYSVTPINISGDEVWSKVKCLAEKYAPTRGGQRNKKMLKYVRAIKPLRSSWSRKERLIAFDMWWAGAVTMVRTSDRDFNLYEFLRAFTLCRAEASVRDWTQLKIESLVEDVPDDYQSFPEKAQNVIRICARLQRIWGDRPFFVAGADLGEAVGLSQKSVSNLILELMDNGYLHRMEKGSNYTGRASVYYYLPVYNPDKDPNR
jgi:hypothetical protein